MCRRGGYASACMKLCIHVVKQFFRPYGARIRKSRLISPHLAGNDIKPKTKTAAVCDMPPKKLDTLGGISYVTAIISIFHTGKCRRTGNIRTRHAFPLLCKGLPLSIRRKSPLLIRGFSHWLYQFFVSALCG